MVQINFALKEVNCKVVYYGPGLSGKTTNLEVVHSKAPKSNVGELTSIATEGDRTLFFDFLPLNLGSVAGMTTKFQIYTVPGQVYYNSTRKLVLQGADGLVFVADSRRGKMDENLESLQNLEENLREYGMDINNIPLVMQYNKRDLPEIYSIEELQQKLNRFNSPYFEAVAVTGEGVFPTLKKLSQMVLESLNRQQGSAVIRRPQKPAVAAESQRAQQKLRLEQPVPVGATAGPPSARAFGGGTAPPARKQGSFATSRGGAPTRPQTKLVREPVADSPGVKQIERRSPEVEPVVRKRSARVEETRLVPRKTRGKAGLAVAAVLLVLAAAAAALYFGGILDSFLRR
jgi:hypothetical protein